MAQRLTESLGSQVIVENKPGAGGVLGIEHGIKAPADGYTLTLIASSYTVNPSIYKLNFDPVTDITPIIQMSQGPLAGGGEPGAAGQDASRNSSRSPSRSRVKSRSPPPGRAA